MGISGSATVVPPYVSAQCLSWIFFGTFLFFFYNCVTQFGCFGRSDTIWETDAWKQVILFTAGFHCLGMFSVVVAGRPAWLDNCRGRALFTLLFS